MSDLVTKVIQLIQVNSMIKNNVSLEKETDVNLLNHFDWIVNDSSFGC